MPKKQDGETLFLIFYNCQQAVVQAAETAFTTSLYLHDKEIANEVSFLSVSETFALSAGGREGSPYNLLCSVKGYKKVM